MIPTKKVDPNQLVSLFDQWVESLSKLGKVRSDTQFKYTMNRLVQTTAVSTADQLLEAVGDMFPKPGHGYPTSRSSASKSALPFETLSTSPVTEELLNKTL